MKRVSLTIANEIRFTITEEFLKKRETVDLPNGMKGVLLGKAEVGKSENVEIARLNGADIIWATLNVEYLMENIVANFIFGKKLDYSVGESFFINEILESSSMNYAFKRKLIVKICSLSKALNGSDRNKLEKSLSKIETFRNAFAHGKIIEDVNEGYILKFYRGESKEIKLDDDYWFSVENNFSLTYRLLENILNHLN